MDGGSQLLIRLIHLFHASHEDLQIDPDQGEEGGLEMDLSLLVDRHVHPDKTLVSQKVRALAAESQRRVDLRKKGIMQGII